MGLFASSNKNGEDINETGLIPGLSYSLVNAIEAKDEKNRKIFLLKLRNNLENSK